MAEKEEHRAEDQEEEGPQQITKCPVCGKEKDPLPEVEEGEKPPMPPSVLIIKFAGPGSSQIIWMGGEGIVTAEQMGAAGQFLQCRAYQEWTMPLVEKVLREAVEQTVAEFLAQVNKPRIETPPFFIPPRGGPPL